VPKVAEILREHYPAPVTDGSVGSFRKRRWKPQKEKIEAEFRALEVLFKEFGGNYGLDLAAFARVRELLNKSDIKEANSVRLAVLKMRAQNLKEEEFKFKTGQLKPGEAAEGGEEDAKAEEAKRKRVMNQIREIFGLPPLPEEESSQEPEDGSQESEVRSQESEDGSQESEGGSQELEGGSEASPPESEPSGEGASEPLEEAVSANEHLGVATESSSWVVPERKGAGARDGANGKG
jgi:hypothetical protein